MFTYVKRLFGVFFGIILLLFTLLGFLIPSGMALNCSRTSKTCNFITRYAFQRSQSNLFRFSEFLDAEAVFTHCVSHSSLYGIKIKTTLGTLEVADFSQQEAEDATLKLKSYIQSPRNNVLIIDSNDDLMHIFGMFACLFGAICSLAVSIFNLPLNSTTKI